MKVKEKLDLNGRVGREQNLMRAWKKVRAAAGSPGADGVSIEKFAVRGKHYLARLGRQITEGRYRFSRLRAARVLKADGTQRKLAIPTVSDRIVLQALRLTLEPPCEQAMLPCSHAYRMQRGVTTALTSVAAALRENRSVLLETDIRDFFDSIRHKPLRRKLAALVPETVSWPLLDRALELSPGILPTRKGLAQGSPLSPLLANVTLLDFDQAMTKPQWTFVRYADDLLVLCATEKDARHALMLATRILAKIGLRLHSEKTRITDGAVQQFQFLGFAFHPDRIIPTDENLAKLRDGIVAWCNPHSKVTWKERVDRINSLLRSFAWYYHQTDCTRLFWTLDTFVAQQLETLEAAVGPPPMPWRSEVLHLSHLREVRWHKKSRSRNGWNNYGGK